MGENELETKEAALLRERETAHRENFRYLENMLARAQATRHEHETAINLLSGYLNMTLESERLHGVPTESQS